MTFVSLTSALKSEWDDLLHTSDDAWVFGLSDWIEMVCAVWNMEDHSFAIRENGRLVATVPLQWIVQERRLSSGGWGHGGAILSSRLIPVDRQRVWKICWSHVEEIAKELRADRVTISISPACRSSVNNVWGVNPLVTAGFEDVSTHVRMLNLSQSENDLWFGLAKDARQKIKQARAAGYSVQRGSWNEMVNDYYLVHQENYMRTGVQPLSKAYFEGISNLPHEHFVLWVGCDPSNVPVAFHNNARFGVMGMYHTGCSKTDHLQSGVNYMLFWEALLGAKSDGLEWYEVGEAFPQVRDGKDKGLTDFKGKFGGELHRLFRGSMVFSNAQLPFQTESVAQEPPGAMAVLHNWLKATRDVLFIVFLRRVQKFMSFLAVKEA